MKWDPHTLSWTRVAEVEEGLMIGHRRLLIGGIALLALAGVLYGTLRVMYGERSAYVHVRWAPAVDPATQEQVERTHALARVEFREQRTWLYHLTDVSTENIRSLVGNPAVEDTHYIDRRTFRIASIATRGPYATTRPAWIADMIEFMVRASVLGGAVALVMGMFNAWRNRRNRAMPSAAA
jgi:hypothetical protein